MTPSIRKGLGCGSVTEKEDCLWTNAYGKVEAVKQPGIICCVCVTEDGFWYCEKCARIAGVIW